MFSFRPIVFQGSFLVVQLPHASLFLAHWGFGLIHPPISKIQNLSLLCSSLTAD